MTHTPLPWHGCRAQDGECTCGSVWSIPGDFPVCTTINNKRYPIALVHEHMADAPDLVYQSITPEAARANAALIVKAVNSHDALRNAVLASQAMLVTWHSLESGEVRDAIATIMDKNTAALALAGET